MVCVAQVIDERERVVSLAGRSAADMSDERDSPERLDDDNLDESRRQRRNPPGVGLLVQHIEEGGA